MNTQLAVTRPANIRRAALISVVLLALLAAGCASSTAKVSKSITHTTTLHSSNVTAPQAVMPDFSATQFPATSKEYNSDATVDWDNFEGQILNTATTACLRTKGFTELQIQSVQLEHSLIKQAPPDLSQYPNLALLATGQTGLPAPHPGPVAPNGSPEMPRQSPSSELPAATLAALEAANDTCSLQAQAPFLSFRKLVGDLRSTYQRLVESESNSDSVMGADQKSFVSCEKNSGVDVDSENAWFNFMDNQDIKSSGNADYGQLHVQEVKTFAKCITPLSQDQDRLRVKIRETFFDAHAPEIAELKNEMNAIVEKLSSKYGVVYGRRT